MYDYVTGKQDWIAHGLPSAGTLASERTARDAVRDDVVTCGLGDRVGEVRALVEASPHGFALVVSRGGVLLGRLRKSALERDPSVTAEEAMEPGPSTIRPHIELASVVERLRERDLRYAIVTTPEGILVGVVRRSDAEERL